MELRPYQKEAIGAFRRFVEDGTEGKRGIVVFPTGCGKTIFGLSLAKAIGGRTLWIAHREELISQPIGALRAVWPEARPGVVKAERDEWSRDFVFASVQTAWRPNRREKLRGFDLVVVDECHHAAAQSYKLVLEAAGCFEDGGPPLLGLTATPERTDNLRLDDVFQKIVYQFQLRTAVEAGYLVGVEMRRRAINVDLDRVRTTAGDFSGDDLDAALLEAGIVDEVCAAVREMAHGRKSIIFTVSVRQAKLISEGLAKAGLRATHVSGDTPRHARRQRLQGLASNQYQHLVNCMVLTEGFDEPTVDCIIMARPTLSKSLYIQCVGRGLRVAPGKTDCLLVDMVGVSSRHTLIQAPAIFGIEDYSDQTTARAQPDEEGSEGFRKSLMLTQVAGVAPLERSRMRWVKAKDNVYALNCGAGGTVLMRAADDPGWHVEIVGRQGADRPREMLTMAPVSLELAQGISEDYVRRASAVYLTNKSAAWRDAPASDRQLEALKKWKIQVPPGVTKGEASDLMTAAAAKSWRNDPATAKQMRALRWHGIPFNEDTLTKGEAGRLLSSARR